MSFSFATKISRSSLRMMSSGTIIVCPSPAATSFTVGVLTVNGRPKLYTSMSFPPAATRSTTGLHSKGTDTKVLINGRATQAASSSSLGVRALSSSSKHSTDDAANTPSSVKPSAIALKMPESYGYVKVNALKRFREFELDGRVYVVTGGAQGLGLTLAEALAEAGAHVYCLDRSTKPADNFFKTKERFTDPSDGSMHYRQVDVQDAEALDKVIADIANDHARMDGLVAAAAVQRVVPALEYPPDKIEEMMKINYRGVYLSAVSCARQMVKHKTPGSMVLIGSMSGLIANKGLLCSVYNSSKAAVIQLGRSLAMEWGQIIDGKPIRVNVLSPGNIVTPMVEQNFKDDPKLKGIWEAGNMMGRLSEPHEYRGAVLFMLSDASSFMTGSNLVIDGGYTAW